MGAGDVATALARGVRKNRAPALAGLIAIGLVCVGALAVVKSDPPSATADVLVDTPRPLLASGVPHDTATAADRASALTSQLLRDPARAIVARSAAVSPTELEIVAAGLSEPASPTPVARAVASARGAAPLVLTVGLRDRRAPVVTLTAAAHDPALAERLVEGGIAALRYLAAPPPGTPAALRIEQLGAVRQLPVSAAPGRAALAAAAVAAALTWLAALGIAGALGDRPAARPNRAEAKAATEARTA